MKLSTPRYTFYLILQGIFVLSDLLFNCVSLFPRSRDSLLIIFIFQDLFLVLSITTLLMMFFSTYLFQAGLVEVLWRRFWCAGVAAGAYAVASVALHAASLAHAATPASAARLAPSEPSEQTAPLAASGTLVAVLFTMQRCLSPWYYFFYKRAALRVSDPRLYDDVGWLEPRPR